MPGFGIQHMTNMPYCPMCGTKKVIDSPENPGVPDATKKTPDANVTEIGTPKVKKEKKDEKDK